MKVGGGEKIIYSINISDVQEVAKEVLDRRLTNKEISMVQELVGDYIDWFQSIENAIRKYVVH